MIVRAERPSDRAAIRALVTSAFADHPNSDGRESAIVDALRANGELTLSLVAEENGAIVGHIAFSPVKISDGSQGWFGLGPVSVEPTRQKSGIGSALIEAGLAQLGGSGAMGVVLMGDPAFYGRFGFAHDPSLVYPGPPPQFFQRLVLGGVAPTGTVTYAPAFG